MTRVVVLAGGFGGAKMAHGFALLGESGEHPMDLTVVVNTADDMELHGLRISPDLDTVMYTLAGLANTAMGWGVRDETWSASRMLERYGAPTWFRLGDRDLATHIARTDALRTGATLTDVTDRLRGSLEVAARLLPMTDAEVRTRLRTDVGWLDFQDYFVRRGHRDRVLELRFDGIDAALPSDQVLAAIARADVVVVAPSNPLVSIGPILALRGVEQAIRERGSPVIAVSPIVAGSALRGPADEMLASLGHEPTAAGVARLYQERHPGLVDAFVIDHADAALTAEVEASGQRAVVTATVMRSDEDRRALAADVMRVRP